MNKDNRGVFIAVGLVIAVFVIVFVSYSYTEKQGREFDEQLVTNCLGAKSFGQSRTDLAQLERDREACRQELGLD